MADVTAGMHAIFEPGWTWVANEKPLLGNPGLLQQGQAVGPLVMDAALAAIAIEHGATLCSTNCDFSRFAEFDWQNPVDRPREERHARMDVSGTFASDRA
jgi:hypothetical protein